MKNSFLLPLLPVLCIAVGCGGSGGSSIVNNPYAGAYNGNLTLDNGKPGVLNLTVTNSGTASGTLQVSAAAPSRGGESFEFSVGTHNVSGTVGSDGTITMSGIDNGTGAGNFTVNGSLLSGGTGNVTINAGGQTYQATVSASGGGGSGSLTLSNGSGTNAIMSPFPSNPLILMSTVGGASAIVASPPGGGNARTLLLLLTEEVTPGTTITFDGDERGNTFRYNEGNDKGWIASSGTATVTARTANSFSITFNNVRMVADADSPATGSFTMNGTLTKQ